MQKKANIYAPLEGNNEGWIVEIIDENHVNTGLHYMDWPFSISAREALEQFTTVEDFWPDTYMVAVFENDRDKPVLRGKASDGVVLGYRYA